MPGPSFTQATRPPSRTLVTTSHEGLRSATSHDLPRAVRRAGSRNTPASLGTWSYRSATSPTITRADAPRFAAANVAITGSRSTAVTSSPAPTSANASSPSPHPRSQTWVTPVVASLSARQRATVGLVACSSPSRVRNSSEAEPPSLRTAARRSDSCPSTAAAFSPGRSRRHRSAADTDSGSFSAAARCNHGTASADTNHCATSSSMAATYRPPARTFSSMLWP